MNSRISGMKKGGGSRNGNGMLVAVGIDRNKGSQNAVRWAIENLLCRGQTVILIHVLLKTLPGQGHSPAVHRENVEKLTKDLFLTFRCYCTRKEIQCHDVILKHDHDVVKAITEYVSQSGIQFLVLGAPTKTGFIRNFRADIPSSITKGAPDFCSVYVISKGKISSLRNASRAAPQTSPLLEEIKSQQTDTSSKKIMNLKDRIKPRTSFEGPVKSQFSRDKGYVEKPLSNFAETDCNSDISFISSGRPSTEYRSSCFDFTDTPSRLISSSADDSFGSIPMGIKWDQNSPFNGISSSSQDSSGRPSFESQNIDEVEAEMRRLKLELKQTMDMYSSACKKAIEAKRQAEELRSMKHEEEEQQQQKVEEAKAAEEAVVSRAEKERAKLVTAMEAADAATKIAKLEAQKKVNIEIKKLEESDEMKRIMGTLGEDQRLYDIVDFSEIGLVDVLDSWNSWEII